MCLIPRRKNDVGSGLALPDMAWMEGMFAGRVVVVVARSAKAVKPWGVSVSHATIRGGSVGARLIVLDIPYFERGGTGAMPAPLKDALARVDAPNLSALDLAPIVERHYADPSAPLLRFDRDRHPNPAAHALMADAIDSFVRGQGLLPGLRPAR